MSAVRVYQAGTRSGLVSAVRCLRHWFRADFQSLQSMMDWFCGQIRPVRTEQGVLWVTDYRHQERKIPGQQRMEFYVLKTGTWTGYFWDTDSDPALALVQETFIKQKGFKV